jgi:hypothetical protein
MKIYQMIAVTGNGSVTEKIEELKIFVL